MTDTDTTTRPIAPGDVVTVDHMGGIAFRVDAWETEPVEEWVLVCCPDDGDPDHEHDDGCYVLDVDSAPTGMVIVHMIGDDRPHVVDPDDCTPIAEGDYCDCCGQIGCEWGGNSDA